MEAAPPAYAAAITQDPLALIADRCATLSLLPPASLARAARVCRAWSRAFVPALWRRIAVDSTEQLAAISRARGATRELVACVVVMREFGAGLGFEDEPPATWLRDFVGRLPRLQALVVSQCPAVDHGSMTAVASEQARSPNQRVARQNLHLGLGGSLRLLEARSLPQATATGLTRLLSKLENLVYLDLSGNRCALDAQVLGGLGRLSSLRVLRLSNMGVITDGQMILLGEAIRGRVASLDLSHCGVTDSGVRVLLLHAYLDHYQDTYPTAPPAYRATADVNRIASAAQTNWLANSVHSILTLGKAPRLAIEDEPIQQYGRLQELLLDGHRLTAAGVSLALGAQGLAKQANVTAQTQPTIPAALDLGSAADCPGLEQAGSQSAVTRLRTSYTVWLATGLRAAWPALQTLTLAGVPLAAPVDDARRLQSSFEKLPGLRAVVLEHSMGKSTPQAGPGGGFSGWRADTSVTGDDASAWATAGLDDFSFFSEGVAGSGQDDDDPADAIDLAVHLRRWASGRRGRPAVFATVPRR